MAEVLYVFMALTISTPRTSLSVAPALSLSFFSVKRKFNCGGEAGGVSQELPLLLLLVYSVSMT